MNLLRNIIRYKYTPALAVSVTYISSLYYICNNSNIRMQPIISDKYPRALINYDDNK